MVSVGKQVFGEQKLKKMGAILSGMTRKVGKEEEDRKEWNAT